MKKKVVILFFVAAAVMLVVSQVSFAQDMKGELGLGARVAYFNYSDDDLGSGFDVDYDGTAMYDANLTYFVHSYFSFELSVGYVETDVDLKGLGISLDIGEFEQIPILLTARTHFSTNPRVSPYIGIGVGYFLNDFDMSGSIPAGYDLDPDDSVGFHVGGGVEIFLNEHFALTIDLKYIWNEVDIDFKAPGLATEEHSVDVDAFTSGIGLKYYF